MKRLLYALVALLAALSFSLGVIGAAWAWGDETWKIVPNPTPDRSTNSSFSSVAAVSPHDVWAVGDYVDKQTETSNALIEHWNGVRWKIVASPNASRIGLNAVAADAANDALAVGTTGRGTLTEHWNGARWRIVASPTGTSKSGIRAVTHVPGTRTAWAAGDFFTSAGRFTLTAFHGNGVL